MVLVFLFKDFLIMSNVRIVFFSCTWFIYLRARWPPLLGVARKFAQQKASQFLTSRRRDDFLGLNDYETIPGTNQSGATGDRATSYSSSI